MQMKSPGKSFILNIISMSESMCEVLLKLKTRSDGRWCREDALKFPIEINSKCTSRSRFSRSAPAKEMAKLTSYYYDY